MNMNAKAPKPTTTAFILIGLTMAGVIITIANQMATTAYAFGQVTTKVDNNRQAIVMLTRQNKVLSNLSSKVDVLQQKLEDDEKLLNSIAGAVGAKGGR